jgi:hypothetical protein
MNITFLIIKKYFRVERAKIIYHTPLIIFV